MCAHTSVTCSVQLLPWRRDAHLCAAGALPGLVWGLNKKAKAGGESCGSHGNQAWAGSGLPSPSQAGGSPSEACGVAEGAGVLEAYCVSWRPTVCPGAEPELWA